MDVARLQALFVPNPTAAERSPAPASDPNFSQVLKQAVERVEQDQRAAADAAVKLVTGESTDLAQVMIASERANLSLGMALQVRNKVLEAYQEIMRMPL